MPRNQVPDSPGKGHNPGQTMPDDDDALDLDRPEVGAQDQQRQDRRRQPETNVEQVEDEEAEDDEDEADGIGPRP